MQVALKAYYQNTYHSAARWMMKPNPWMAANASYVEISDDRTQRWSTFEDYKMLIAILYYAAIDRSIDPIDNYTFEGRVEGFFKELAYIGRAHNWDRSRFKLDTNGRRVKDSVGKDVTEQYDDAEGDKPSCFSGVNLRLFISVQGHPFWVILKEQIVDQAIREFVAAYYLKVYKPEVHGKAVQIVLFKVTIEDEPIPEEAFKTISTLNFTKEHIDEIIINLRKKYGDQVEEYLPRILGTFALSKEKQHSHFMTFYTAVDLPRLLKIEFNLITSSSSTIFASPTEQTTESISSKETPESRKS